MKRPAQIPLPPAVDEKARPSWPQASVGSRDRLLPVEPDGEAVGQAQVGDREGDHRHPDRERRQRRAERTPAPEPQRHRSLGDDQEGPVRMDRRQEPGRSGRCERPAPGALLVGDEEEVDRECRCEDVQRVHPRERPVDEQERGRRYDQGGDRPGHRAAEAPADVPAERKRCEREDDREPAERERRRVERQRNVGEDEVERAAAALPHDRLDHLAERTGGDQAADGLVLEERLPLNVVDEAREQDPGARQQRADREDEREGLSPRPARRPRPGRPGRGAPVRGGTRATRRHR